MALRVYRDQEGREWRVWHVMPAAISAATLEEPYRGGWLCFERVDGTERCRLSMTEVPPAWEALPAQRLDLLRRNAEPATLRSGPTTQETEQRDRRASGPKSAIGGEEE
jgi:hypothetical protein